MVEALIANWGGVAQPALNLIRDRQSSQELLAGAVRVLAGRQDRAQVIARMAGLILCQIAVVEIEVSDQGRIVKGRAVRRGSARANCCAQGCSAKFLDLRQNCPNWRAAQGADRAPQRIENADLQLQPC